MPRPAPVFAFLTALAALGPAACNDFDDIRRSGKGESCTRTDDCRSPLVCVDLTCVDPGGTGGSGAGTTITGSTTEGGGGGGTTNSPNGGAGGATTTTTSEGGAGGGGNGGGTGGLDPEVCATCIDAACSTQVAACDSGCVAIEACIQMTCAHLSAIGSSDEGLCQKQCQDPHPASKQKHINLVNCAISSWPGCSACSSYPFDYNACVVKASGGTCQASLDACNASNDCAQYRECVGGCATLAACLACDDTPAGQAGRALFSEYNLCLASDCLAEAWLP